MQALLILCAAFQREPGVAVRFEAADGSARDARVDRLIALYVPAGTSPTPFLPPGRFRAVWDAFLDVPDFDEYTFSVEGRGSLRVEINGRDVLERAGSRVVELEPGPCRIVVRFESPPDGDAWVRLLWASPSFSVEPLPPSRLSHDATDASLRRRLRIRAGRERFASHRCHRCHESPVRAGMPELSEEASSFEEIGARLRPEWIARWILEPDPPMPKLLRADDSRSARDLAAYLATLGTPAADPAGGVAERGRVLFETIGCAACHTTGARDPERVSLQSTAHKWRPAALVAFLRRPDRYSPSIAMPDFGLRPQEAEDLAAYLRSVAAPATGDAAGGDAERGRALVRSLGCAACHPRAEPSDRKVRPMIRTAEPTGCLASTPDRRGTAPDFALKDEQRAALAEFLLHGVESLCRDSPVEYAERKIRALRCGACHERDGAVDAWSRLTSDRPAPASVWLQDRPSLTWTGEKLTPEWAAAFLSGRVASPVRPWLVARMPRFAVDAALLAEGLALQHGVPPRTAPSPPPDDATVEAGRRLAGKDRGFGCVTCHDGGDENATGAFDARGPDLRLLAPRLRREFFLRLMDDPGRVMPNTKMPAFVAGKRSPYTDLYDGDPRRQAEAIWQYLLKIGSP
jgi:mono/diheme cytochrome c family protein